MNSTTTVHRAPPITYPPADVFASPGPIVSVYLNTNGAVPGAAEQVALRWKNLRRRLLDDDVAPAAALDVIEPLTVRAHAFGPALVAIAGTGGLLYSTHLPESRDDDLAVVGPLPHLVPLLAVAQRLLPYIVVVTDRLGAEFFVVRPDATDLRTEVEGEEKHVTRSAPGGWSQRRFQQRAENRWEANARGVADALTRLADTHSPRLVVVSGDVRAVQFLRDHLPSRVTDLLTEIQGEYRDIDEALRLAEQIVAARADADAEEALAAHARELGQDDLATAGPAATLDALVRGQVDTLLLDPTRTTGQTAWFGPDVTQVAATARALRSAGVADPQQAQLVDVAIRAALGTAAGVRITLPGAGGIAPSGIGALLR